MRTVNLWDYLPPFLKEFREFQVLIDVQTPEVQELQNRLDRMMDNCFITTAHDEGLKRFEKLLGIFPAEGESEEYRRSTILSRWFDRLPFTVRGLIQRISIIQGNNNIQVYFDDDDPYTVHIVTRLEEAGQVDSLIFIFRTMIPANLVIDSQNRIECESDLGINYAVGMTDSNYLFLTNDLNETVQQNIPEYAGMGLSVTGSLYLTD